MSPHVDMSLTSLFYLYLLCRPLLKRAASGILSCSAIRYSLSNSNPRKKPMSITAANLLKCVIYVFFVETACGNNAVG